MGHPTPKERNGFQMEDKKSSVMNVQRDLFKEDFPTQTRETPNVLNHKKEKFGGTTELKKNGHTINLKVLSKED